MNIEDGNSENWSGLNVTEARSPRMLKRDRTQVTEDALT